MKLDLIDCRILNALQEQGRLSNQELADKISLSPSACFRRVKLLEESGIISSYKAVLNFKKVGFGVEAIIHVSIEQSQSDWHDHFSKEIAKMSEVVNAYVVTGDCNHILFVRSTSLEAFSNFIINRLNKINGVKDLCTYIVLDCISNTQIMHIEPI